MSSSIRLLYIPFSRKPTVSDVDYVNIGINASVGDLKEVIKEKNLYGEFKSSDLKLYDVSKLKDPIYVGEDVLDGDPGFAKRVLHTCGDRPLRAIQVISSVYSQQPDIDRLHIVIKSPMLRLFCILETETPAAQDIFKVDIKDTMIVDDLKEAIMNKKFGSEQIPTTSSLVLWRVSLPYETDLDAILKNGSRSMLIPAEDTVLSQIFCSAHIERLHVIVQIPTIRRVDNTKASSSESRQEDVGLQRDLYNIKNPPKTPSIEGQYNNYARYQRNPAQQILCNRPSFAMSTIPVTLLHRVFGQFLDDCQNHPTEAADNSFALKLSIAMSDFYKDEKARADKVRELFEDYDLHFVASETPNHFRTDGDIRFGGYCYAIAEFKNEVGSTGAEPYAQASLYYHDCTRDSAPKLSGSPLPCFIVLMFGPYLGFAGAAWNLRPIQQTLSTILPLHYHPSDTNTRAILARHLAALKKGISSLDEYYRKLSSSTPTTQTRSQLFPYPTSFNDSSSGKLHSFEYTNQISDDKLLFLAKLNETGEKICVKFVRDYSVDAHLFCARHGFAPVLRCYERIPGDWKMVVMDAIDDYVELCDSHLPAPHPIFTKIEEKLNELHQHNFVHGDIRDTNIMISKDKETFMLVDFDWGGEIGKATYPMNVNRKDMWRPEGAEDGKLIIADHDMAMLKHMKEQRITRLNVNHV